MASFWIGIAGVIIAGGAVIMAVLPLLQQLFGEPKIKIEFGHWDVGARRTLFCFLDNLQITNKSLLLLRVHRVIVHDVSIEFSIWDIGKKRWVYVTNGSGTVKRNFYAVMQTDGEENRHILFLPPTTVRCPIAEATTKDGASFTEWRVNGSWVYPLEIGDYQLHMRINYSGRHMKVLKRFSVGNKPTDLNWLKVK